MTRLALSLLAALPAAAQTAPFAVPDTVEFRTVVFSEAGGIPLQADLYLPKGAGPFPAAVYIHGGGWSGGVRTQLRRQAAYLASQGVAGMAIDYRLSGQALFPAALEDAREAVRWLRAHAAEYRIAPARIAAVGSSAGGHLAAMLGVTGGAAGHVAAVAAFNPVLDLTGMGQPGGMAAQFLGKTYEQAPELYRQASPVTHADRHAAPFLILHGTADQTVPYAQAVEMVRKLKAAGAEAELFSAEGAPHTFWADKRWYGPTTKALEAFLLRHLR